MRRFALILLCVASTAWAGDRLLGVIGVNDAGTVNNATTGYGAAGCPSDSWGGGASCTQAFSVGTGLFLDIQCRQAGVVRVNAPHVDAGNGVVLAAGQLFPTSTGTATLSLGPLTSADGGNKIAGGMPDGGTYQGGLVSIAPAAGSTSIECSVFQRNGNE